MRIDRSSEQLVLTIYFHPFFFFSFKEELSLSLSNRVNSRRKLNQHRDFFRYRLDDFIRNWQIAADMTILKRLRIDSAMRFIGTE